MACIENVMRFLFVKSPDWNQVIWTLHCFPILSHYIPPSHLNESVCVYFRSPFCLRSIKGGIYCIVCLDFFWLCLPLFFALLLHGIVTLEVINHVGQDWCYVSSVYWAILYNILAADNSDPGLNNKVTSLTEFHARDLIKFIYGIIKWQLLQNSLCT